MNPNVPMFLDARARARATGDRGLERAVQADLDRIGYREPVVTEIEPPKPKLVERDDGMETTAVKAPERAVPQLSPRGRPKHPGRKR